jgi:hypothetical protein
MDDSARVCIPQIEIDGKPLRFKPRFIVDDLRAAFAKASESFSKTITSNAQRRRVKRGVITP